MQDKNGEPGVPESNLTKGLRITFVCKTTFRISLVPVHVTNQRLLHVSKKSLD